MLKRYYAEDNATMMMVITDGEKAIAFDVSSREEAISMDTEGIDSCETIEEVECETSKTSFDFNEDEFELLEEIKKIIGEKATYIVEEINNIGDYRITIYGHDTYKDGQSWMVGNFEYMESINRVEAGKKMLLEER